MLPLLEKPRSRIHAAETGRKKKGRIAAAFFARPPAWAGGNE